jgi:arabinogalactan oligomer/maltooligosaccharide transport system substrate-binding protein
MPWTIQTSGLFYNTALVAPSFFRSHPMAWAGVIAKAKALTDLRAHKYGLAWDFTNFYLDYAFVSGSGGYVFKDTSQGFDRRQLGIDAPRTIAGLQLIRDLTTAGKYDLVPGDMTGTTAEALFTKGKLAMFITNQSEANTFRQFKIHFGFTPMPSVGTHPSHPYSVVQVFAVNKLSKHSKEAFSLLQYLTTRMQVPEYSVSGALPVVRRDLTSASIRTNSVAGGMVQAALNTEPVPNISEMNQVWGPMNLVLRGIARGELAPADAAHLAANEIRQAIAKAGG